MASRKRVALPAWRTCGSPPGQTRSSSRCPRAPATSASSSPAGPARARSSAPCARRTGVSSSRLILKYRWYNRGMADSCGHTPPARSVSGKPGARKVFCVKFQKELPGLDAPPWPGELGQRIFENVSADAWKLWEDRMKMILNEYRLMPWQKEAQDLVAKHMEDFFFGEGAALPPGYVPQQAK